MAHCELNTSLLGRDLTEDEMMIVQESIDAFNANGRQNLFGMTIGPNFCIKDGDISGVTMLLSKNAPVVPDLLQTAEYGKARLAFRVKKTDRDGNPLDNHTYRSAEKRQNLLNALPLAVPDVENTFGAHTVDQDGLYADQHCVPTLGDQGAAGVAMYTQTEGFAKVDRDMIVVEVVPQAFAQQASAHIAEAYNNGLTIGQMIENKTASNLSDAMGTCSANVFGLYPDSTNYKTVSQFVSLRCARAAAERVADVFGLEFEEADITVDDSSATGASVVVPMAQAFTNIIVPVSNNNDLVLFYKGMVSTQLCPVIPYADHALSGWKLVTGPIPAKSHDRPAMFNAEAFGNTDLMWSYPFEAPAYSSVDEIPEQELSVNGIQNQSWVDAASQTLVYSGLTTALSPTYNVGSQLSGDSLDEAAKAHEQAFTTADMQCRADGGTTFVGMIKDLDTRVMRVAEISPLDRPLYQGDSVFDEGEMVAQRIIASRLRGVNTLFEA
ncbi:MAG: hypothetical protein CMP20_15405 [Rickettsiales bacterium]|nr:hypothetical protein [Rickettsiales bacterium]